MTSEELREAVKAAIAGADNLDGMADAALAVVREALREAIRACLVERSKGSAIGANVNSWRAGLRQWAKLATATPVPNTDALASALAQAKKEGYREGWNDRESDFLRGVERTGMMVLGPDAIEQAKAEEREACAHIAQDRESEGGEYAMAARHIAAAIRAAGG